MLITYTDRNPRSPQNRYSPARRESPSQSRSNPGRGYPLGNPRQNSQGSARAGQSPPAQRRAHRPRGRPGRSNTPNWRSAPARVSGANAHPIGSSAQGRPIRAANPVLAREDQPRHLSRSGHFPSSEVCRGTGSGCRCWVCHPTPPPAYTVGSGDLVVEEVNPPRSGGVRW